MFADVVGSAALAEQLGPEEFGEILSAYHKLCLSAVQKRHGYVAQFLGDGVLAYFGYPVAFEDSAICAVQAALDIVQEVRGLSLPALDRLSQKLEVRLGIHTGAVSLEAVGGGARREILALGEAPNIASRVQAAAAAGSVVITDATESCLRGAFELKPLGAPSLKGISRPINLFEITRARAEPSVESSESDSTPFVGRTQETNVLLQGWERALAGSSEVFLITGEAGIGKSRQVAVLKELLAPARPALLEAHCDEHHQASALYPIASFIQSRLVGTEAATVPDTLEALEQWEKADASGSRRPKAALLLRLLGLPIDDRFGPFTLTADETRIAMFEMISEWIGDEVARGPALLVIEDLHWADPSTMDFLTWRLQTPLCAGSLTILTARPELQLPNMGSAQIKELSLTALNRSDCTLMVEQLARRTPLPRQVIDQLVSNAAGVPLFVEETAKAVLSSSLLDPDLAVRTRALAEYGMEIVPTSLHTSITARLDRLGTARAVAQLAAVFGTEFRLDVFVEVLTHVNHSWRVTEHYDNDLDALVRAQILVRHAVDDQTIYAFRHALLRKAAYESLGKRTRTRYHRAVAETLVERRESDNSARPELIAAHFSAAGMPEDAVPFWNAAAQRAMLASAHVETISHLNHALQELAELPRSRSRDRQELLIRERLGFVHILIGGFTATEVATHYQAALELCRNLGDEVQDRPEVLYGLWVYNFVRGDLRNTLELVPHYLSLVQYTNDPATQLLANAALGNLAFYRGEYPRAIRHLELAHQLSKAALAEHRAADLLKNGGEGLLYGALYLCWAHALCGQRASALAALREALKLLDVLDYPYATAQAYTFAATVLRELGMRRISTAIGMIVQADYKRFAFWLGCSTVLAGSGLSYYGESERGIPMMREGISLLLAIGVRVPTPHHLGCLAEAQLSIGDETGALETVDQAIEMSRNDIDHNFLPDLLRIKALIVSRRQPQAARELLANSLELSRSQSAQLFIERAETLLQHIDAGSDSPMRELRAAASERAPTLEEARELVRRLRADPESALGVG